MFKAAVLYSLELVLDYLWYVILGLALFWFFRRYIKSKLPQQQQSPVLRLLASSRVSHTFFFSCVFFFFSLLSKATTPHLGSQMPRCLL